MALYNLKRYEEAAEVYEQAHRDDADFYNSKGMALLDLNYYEEALEALGKEAREPRSMRLNAKNR